MDDLVRVESSIECIKPLVSNLEIVYGLVELGLKLPPKAEQTTKVALQALQIIDKWGHDSFIGFFNEGDESVLLKGKL